jgi:hypothetical protein
MKKFQISKALIGLLVVLTFGFGLAACTNGEYSEKTDGGLNGATLTLEKGKKWSYKEPSPSTVTASGTYEKVRKVFTFKVTAADAGFYFSVGDKFSMVKVGDALYGSLGLYQKSVAGEVTFALEYADDYDFDEDDEE